MKIFSDFDVYEHKYTYEEAKVMYMIGEFDGSTICDNLDYEDACRIAEAIYAHWIDGRDASEDEKYAMFPWLEIETEEEDHYIQAYAQRVLENFIELYKEEYLY